MSLDPRSPSPGRFTWWAVMLALPLILSAAAMPWALEQLRAGRRTATATLSRAGQDGAEEPASAPVPPRHPEAPTTSEIEADRAARIEEAEIQRRNLAGTETFAPRQLRTTVDGERVAPFEGFGLSVDSSPPGARVRVDGRDVGETPILTSVDCTPGREVEVRLEKRGFRPVRRAARCRADALIELSFVLVR